MKRAATGNQEMISAKKTKLIADKALTTNNELTPAYRNRLLTSLEALDKFINPRTSRLHQIKARARMCQTLGLYKRVLEDVVVLRIREPEDGEAFVIQAEALRVVRPAMALTDLVKQGLTVTSEEHRARLLELLKESGGELPHNEPEVDEQPFEDDDEDEVVPESKSHVDPLNMPPEIFQKIMQTLTTAEKYVATRVSKGWKDAITNDTHLWTEINVTHFGCMNALSERIEKTGDLLKFFIAKGMDASNPTNESMRAHVLVKTFGSAKRLQVLRYHGHFHLSLNSLISRDNVLSNLTGPSSSLQELVVNCFSGKRDVLKAIRNMPNLKKLRLLEVHHKETQTQWNWGSPGALQHLTLVEIRGVKDYTLYDPSAKFMLYHMQPPSLAAAAPNLKDLVLKYVNKVQDGGPVPSFYGLSNLRSLSIVFNQVSHPFFALPPRLEQLTWKYRTRNISAILGGPPLLGHLPYVPNLKSLTTNQTMEDDKGCAWKQILLHSNCHLEELNLACEGRDVTINTCDAKWQGALVKSLMLNDQLKGLKTLGFGRTRHCHNPTDEQDIADLIPARCPNLVKLKVDGCMGFNKDQALTMLTELKKLEEFGAPCPLNDADIVRLVGQTLGISKC